MSITPLGDSTEDFPEAKTKIIHPELLRDPGRPCVNRKRSWTEMDSQKKPRCCTRCCGPNHNKSTCKGGEVGSNPKKRGARTECQVDGESFVEKAAVPKRIRKKYAASTSTAATEKASTSASTAATKKASTSASTAAGTNKKKATKTSTGNTELYSKRQRKAKVPYDV
ncbi:hypothetical protein MKW98_020388 [Papaver atlanticum]|uniref:Uncharacterized protein n=1 Tax=Papaver atlanticum TaxID=357466 RepID=A0AAD4X3E2_9MAGN|nr:hypothetical protein MKW98_020388 [Papaver atlanticum]